MQPQFTNSNNPGTSAYQGENDKLIVSTTHFANVNNSSGYKLRWSRFRKLKNLEIHFPPDGIVLLDGRSGIGKTSILDAISFVLYDDAGNTCYPRQERASKRKQDSTWVELTFPTGLIIFRQRRPNILRVQGLGIDLIDDSAQGYINRTLGSLNNWLVGGYLQQSKMCSFFSMSSDDKLTLLQQMSSSGSSISAAPEKFDQLLNKTLEKMTILSRQVQELELQCKVYAELYLTVYNQCSENVRSRKLWTKEELSAKLIKYGVVTHGEQYNKILQQLLSNVRIQSQNQIQTIQNCISQNQIKIAQIKESLQQRERLQDLLKDNEHQLKDFPVNVTDIIHQYEQELEQLLSDLRERTQNKIRTLQTMSEKQVKLTQIKENLRQRGQLQNLLKDNECKLKELPSNIIDMIQQHEKDLRNIEEQIILAQRSERRSQLLATKSEIQRRFDMIPNEQSKFTTNDLNNYDQILSGPTVSQIENQLNDITFAKEYQKCQLINNQIGSLQKQFDLHQKQMDSYQTQLNSYPTTSLREKLDSIGRKIWALSLQKKKLVCPKCETALQLNDGKLNVIEDCNLHTDDSLDELMAQQSKYEQMEKFYQERSRVEELLNLEKNKSQRIEQLLNAEKDKLQNFNNTFDPSIKPKLINFTSYQLDEKANQLNNLKIARKNLPTNIDITGERKKIENMQERNQLSNHIEQISNELITLNCGENQPAEVKNLESRRLDINNRLIQYRNQENMHVGLLATNKQLLEQLKHHPEQDFLEFETDIKKLEAEYESVLHKSQELENRQLDINKKLTEHRAQENKRLSLLVTKEQLLEQLKCHPERDTLECEANITRLRTEHESVTQESQKLEEDINAQLQVSQLVEFYNQHNNYQTLHQETNRKLISLQKIRGTLITAEYIILDNVLTELNRMIGEILDILFIEPISVTIRSLRQLKTDNRIKPQINCQITYEGAECSKIGELSGGEGMRVSLALAIAFSRFSNTPFLLLDESLSPLDVITKESTINMIRKYLPDKLIIAVNHDTTVGVYDSVIKLIRPGE